MKTLVDECIELLTKFKNPKVAKTKKKTILKDVVVRILAINDLVKKTGK
jgi:hypothetical protein